MPGLGLVGSRLQSPFLLFLKLKLKLKSLARTQYSVPRRYTYNARTLQLTRASSLVSVQSLPSLYPHTLVRIGAIASSALLSNRMSESLTQTP